MSTKEDRAKLFEALEAFPHDPLCVKAIDSLKEAITNSTKQEAQEEAQEAAMLQVVSNPGQLKDFLQLLQSQVNRSDERLTNLERRVYVLFKHSKDARADLARADLARAEHQTANQRSADQASMKDWKSK